jgi:hypothetical protein
MSWAGACSLVSTREHRGFDADGSDPYYRIAAPRVFAALPKWVKLGRTFRVEDGLLDHNKQNFRSIFREQGGVFAVW